MPHVAVVLSLFDRKRPEALGEETAREVHALGRLFSPAKALGHSPNHPDVGGKGRTKRQV